MIRRVLLIIVAVVMLGACSRQPDPRLARVAGMVSEQPEAALAALDSMAVDSLSEADRHYHDFLTVKARDKAYITHTSDSLILNVISYYEGSDLYPEALYYGGRVYSDLGDYPTALSYFHQALDLLPEDTDNLELRKRTLSQTGRLLTNLRLYNEAVPYLYASLKIYEQQNDTNNIIFSLQLLGDTYLRAEDYEKAKRFFSESYGLSKNYSSSTHIAKSKMYLAAVKYKSDNIDSALFYIQNTAEAVKPIARNSALAYSSQIYLKAGLLDSAYKYSNQLIHSEDPKNREIGYQVILSPQLRSMLNTDSVNEYMSDFCDLLETYYDENESNSVINKENNYNYTLHERDKNKALLSNENLLHWINIFIFIIIILLFTLLIYKLRSKNRIIKLHRALDDIEKLKQELVKEKSTNVNSENISLTNVASNSTSQGGNIHEVNNPDNENNLRERLRTELLALCNSNDDVHVDSKILKSDTYNKLLDLLSASTSINDKSGMWSEIRSLVLDSSPAFISKLMLLTNGKITKQELHAALLVKCGFKQSQMRTLLGRSPGAVNSRRETLCVKILNGKPGLKGFDKVIKSL